MEQNNRENSPLRRFFTAITLVFTRYYRNSKNEKLRNSFLQNIPFWIAASITGAIAVLYAKVFTFVEELSWELVEWHSWIIFILSPVCFLLSWWIVDRFAKNAAGSGIPQVMTAIHIAQPKNAKKLEKLLSIRIIIVKVLSSLVKIFGGGLLGREGPTIQIGSSIFFYINQHLPKWIPPISRANVIMAGGASGLAAAFNTPLGGIVFAIEELSKTQIKYFKTALFTGVIISGIVSQLLGSTYLYLGFPKLSNLTYKSFIPVVIVAIVAGLSGALLGKMTLWMMKFVRKLKLKSNKVIFVLASGLIVATIIYFFGHDGFGSGKDLMDRLLFQDNKSTSYFTPLIRFVGLIFTFASGGSGGIFAPSLSIGAAIGAQMAEIVHFSQTNTNLLILAGMVSFLTGMTRSPITCAIIVLEMTDRHSAIFYLMVAGVISNLSATSVDSKSFYHRLMHQYLANIFREPQKPALVTETNESKKSEEQSLD